MQENRTALVLDTATFTAEGDGAPTALEPVPRKGTPCPPRTDQPGVLSAIDEAIQLVDSADEPWSVHLEARVAGVLDGSRLRTAAAAAVVCHPRARARRTDRGRWPRRWAWEIGPAPDPQALVEVVNCPDDAALDPVRAELQSRFIPLTQSPALRLCLAHHPGGDVVMLNLNHAAGDGIAALRLLRSTARAYSGQRDRVVSVPGGLAAIPLRRRSRPRVLAGELAELVSKPGRVASEGGLDAPGYGFHHLRLTVEASWPLITRRPGGATVNDLLLAALHLAIEAWNAEHGAPTDRISVLMPANLRPPGCWHEGVTNASFTVPVSTRARHRVDSATVLARVNGRTREVKQWRTPAAVVGLLARLQRLPLPLKGVTACLLSRGRFVKTAILSNLGRVDDPPSFGSDGGDVIEMWFSPPAKMPLGLAIGALTLGGRLHLSFRYRHPLFSPAAAARFADGYVAALESLTTGPPAPDGRIACRRDPGRCRRRPGEGRAEAATGGRRAA